VENPFFKSCGALRLGASWIDDVAGQSQDWKLKPCSKDEPRAFGEKSQKRSTGSSELRSKSVVNKFPLGISFLTEPTLSFPVIWKCL